jgi:hypothetical protein
VSFWGIINIAVHIICCLMTQALRIMDPIKLLVLFYLRGNTYGMDSRLWQTAIMYRVYIAFEGTVNFLWFLRSLICLMTNLWTSGILFRRCNGDSGSCSFIVRKILNPDLCQIQVDQLHKCPVRKYNSAIATYGLLCAQTQLTHRLEAHAIVVRNWISKRNFADLVRRRCYVPSLDC